MKRIATIVALVGLALAGCTTSTSPLTIQSVQAAAVTACAFLPTATTVANLIAANVPTLTTAAAIAAAICAAVVPKTSVRGAGKPTVAGVVIDGAFTK